MTCMLIPTGLDGIHFTLLTQSISRASTLPNEDPQQPQRVKTQMQNSQRV